ncbi:MAG: hypothetical protein KH111_09615 [Bacteroidales bacterium]|nr:hypothetical protein [Bacteroidales bacterium]
MADKRTIVIDLDNSLYAHGFKSEQQIHQEDLDKTIGIIRNQLQQIDVQEDQDVFLTHLYRTIGVFGDRGSGKTSFMISLLNKCKDELKKDVEVLRMIDPTLVEHKKPIVLCVISMIQQKVEPILRLKECSTTGTAYEQRRTWDKVMARISKGIFAIDKVGKDYDNSLWQDEAYVMHTGLARVNDANEFEANLREMIKMALGILDKKAFVLAFDDIDVDVEQGWNVLESLRRYLSDTRIISIVSGNIKLYGSLVRYELCKNLKMPDGFARELMTNELESQYMLKLLNPSNRINLLSLSQLLQNPENIVNVKTEKTINELEWQYRSILADFGIIDTPSQNTFKDFLLSMSLRSQIHFLKDACMEKRSNLPLDVFTSRLYAYGIDIGALSANIQMMNIALLEYLNVNTNLPDCYLLMPTLPDKDVNSNFMALTLLECWYLRKNPFLVFDYMLRIGYIRNVILPLETGDLTVKLCKYAGWNQLMSLKNNMGLTMAYVAGKELGSMKEHISLFAMEGKAKKAKETQMNALDNVLKEEVNSFVRLMAMFPFIRITHNKNNESRSYYSLAALLAVVGDVLRCMDKDEMIGRINDLKLFRGYQMPQDEDYFGEDGIIDGDDFGVETGQNEILELAKLMYEWKEAYHDCMLPPYALGRIMTRLYTSLSNVAVSSVGQMMNVMVANFFNACLIEETRVRNSAQEQGEINNSNLRSDTRYFKDNLGKTDIVDKLVFTKWMMSCPMMNCFLDEETYDKVQGLVADELKIARESYPVYELLCKINSKDDDDSKPSFSGEKTEGWIKTADILRQNGIDDNTIQEKIIYEEDIVKVTDFIKSTNLFGNVYKSSVESFKDNYQREVSAVEVVAPNSEEGHE